MPAEDVKTDAETYVAPTTKYTAGELTESNYRELAAEAPCDWRIMQKEAKRRNGRSPAAKRARRVLEKYGLLPAQDPEVAEWLRQEQAERDTAALVKVAREEHEAAKEARFAKGDDLGSTWSRRVKAAEKKLDEAKAMHTQADAAFEPQRAKLAAYRVKTFLGSLPEIDALESEVSGIEGQIARRSKQLQANQSAGAKVKAQQDDADDDALIEELSGKRLVIDKTIADLETMLATLRRTLVEAKNRLMRAWAARANGHRAEVIQTCVAGVAKVSAYLGEQVSDDGQWREDTRALRTPDAGDLWAPVRTELQNALSLLPKS